MSNSSLVNRQRSGCPLCGKPPHVDAAPFCGPICRDRDLLQWLGDGYRIPGPTIEDDSDASGLDNPA